MINDPIQMQPLVLAIEKAIATKDHMPTHREALKSVQQAFQKAVEDAVIKLLSEPRFCTSREFQEAVRRANPPNNVAG